ncbi:hypothetical protein D3C81_558090 [compost metagenome]
MLCFQGQVHQIILQALPAPGLAYAPCGVRTRRTALFDRAHSQAVRVVDPGVQRRVQALVFFAQAFKQPGKRAWAFPRLQAQALAQPFTVTRLSAGEQRVEQLVVILPAPASATERVADTAALRNTRWQPIECAHRGHAQLAGSVRAVAGGVFEQCITQGQRVMNLQAQCVAFAVRQGVENGLVECRVAGQRLALFVVGLVASVIAHHGLAGVPLRTGPFEPWASQAALTQFDVRLTCPAG